MYICKALEHGVMLHFIRTLPTAIDIVRRRNPPGVHQFKGEYLLTRARPGVVRPWRAFWPGFLSWAQGRSVLFGDCICHCQPSIQHGAGAAQRVNRV
jgi:hypothetical protein